MIVLFYSVLLTRARELVRHELARILASRGGSGEIPTSSRARICPTLPRPVGETKAVFGQSSLKQSKSFRSRNISRVFRKLSRQHSAMRIRRSSDMLLGYVMLLSNFGTKTTGAESRLGDEISPWYLFPRRRPCISSVMSEKQGAWSLMGRRRNFSTRTESLLFSIAQ